MYRATLRYLCFTLVIGFGLFIFISTLHNEYFTFDS